MRDKDVAVVFWKEPIPKEDPNSEEAKRSAIFYKLMEEYKANREKTKNQSKSPPGGELTSNQPPQAEESESNEPPAAEDSTSNEPSAEESSSSETQPAMEPSCDELAQAEESESNESPPLPTPEKEFDPQCAQGGCAHSKAFNPKQQPVYTFRSRWDRRFIIPDPIETDYNRPTCPIHTKPVGLFEEMPSDHCYYKNCPFHIEMFTPKKSRKKPQLQKIPVEEFSLPHSIRKKLPDLDTIKKQAFGDAWETVKLPKPKKYVKVTPPINLPKQVAEEPQKLITGYHMYPGVELLGVAELPERNANTPPSETSSNGRKRKTSDEADTLHQKKTRRPPTKKVVSDVESPETETSAHQAEKSSNGRKKQTMKEDVNAKKAANQAKKPYEPYKWTDTPKRVTRASKKQLFELLDADEPPETDKRPTAKKKIILSYLSDEEEAGPSAPKASTRYFLEKRVEQNAKPREREGNGPLRLESPFEIGLRNRGQTCFVNATIQCLFTLKDFMQHLNRLCDAKPRLNECIAKFNRLAMTRQNGLASEVETLNADFIKSLHLLDKEYSKGEQQDANEFLNRLLTLIRNEFPADNPVDRQVNFKMTETFRCTNCQADKSSQQIHMSLCLSIPEESETLEDCVRAHLQEEERPSRCDRCGRKKVAISSRFDTIPNILILTMKRYTEQGKVEKNIDAPNILNLKDFLSPGVANTRLQKKAEIIHRGASPQYGHYIANVFCEDGLWRSYNDNQVQFHHANSGVKDLPYIYIYQKLPTP